ncbi:MAG: hypothetical protein PX638_09970, partial [Microcystis sp. M53599_WE4]|nr:hypothetical protein [Microcystis sp. M53599_WE4]
MRLSRLQGGFYGIGVLGCWGVGVLVKIPPLPHFPTPPLPHFPTPTKELSLWVCQDLVIDRQVYFLPIATGSEI